MKLKDRFRKKEIPKQRTRELSLIIITFFIVILYFTGFSIGKSITTAKINADGLIAKPIINVDREKSTDILSTDKINTDLKNTDSNKVFSQEEKTSYNKAFSGEKAYRSPDISYEYTEKEFKEFITKKVDHIVKEISPEEYDASVEPISAIIAYFYKRYYKCMGKRHPILTDAAYTKIIMKLIEPVEDIWKRDFRLDKTVYYAMIDQFFKTDYGVKSGNITDYRMSYFMSDTVQSNLVYRSGII